MPTNEFQFDIRSLIRYSIFDTISIFDTSSIFDTISIFDTVSIFLYDFDIWSISRNILFSIRRNNRESASVLKISFRRWLPSTRYDTQATSASLHNETRTRKYTWKGSTVSHLASSASVPQKGWHNKVRVQKNASQRKSFFIVFINPRQKQNLWAHATRCTLHGSRPNRDDCDRTTFPCRTPYRKPLRERFAHEEVWSKTDKTRTNKSTVYISWIVLFTLSLPMASWQATTISRSSLKRFSREPP